MYTTTSTNQTASQSSNQVLATERLARQHQLDWLRVFALGLLIFYHTAMVFVAEWGFHFKSVYQSESLQHIMLIVEPWRMACLWFISGVALQTAFSHVSSSQLILRRSFHLLFPLLIGVLVVVPPQLYVEMTTSGHLEMSFIEFMREFFSTNSPIFNNYQSGIWPHIDVNHLWYLRSLWKYSLVIIVCSPMLNSDLIHRYLDTLIANKLWLIVLLCYLPLVWLQFFLDGDDKRYVSGFVFLLYGFIAAKHPVIWSKLARNLSLIATVALLNFVFMQVFYHMTFSSAFQSLDADWLPALRVSYSMAKLLGLFTMLAIASRFFNRKSDTVSRLNEYVYPCYILHQTYIVVIAWLLSFYTLGGPITYSLIVGLTGLACALSIWLIKQSSLLKICFGMPISKRLSPVFYWSFYPLATLGCLFIGLEILF